jgi:sodium/bile acid cotransporter 7
VVLTRNSGGDDAAAMVEVMIGNILGPFITPGLCYALLPKDGPWEGWLPVASSGLGDMYRSVFQQIGLSVLVPLAAGQTLQWLFPERVKSLVALFHLPKVSTACLILLVW